MSLKGIYQTNVITCTPNHLVTEAARMMRDHHVGDLVVVLGEEDKKPVGLVTDRDITVGCVASAADRIVDLSVEEIMTKNPVCVPESTGVYDVVNKMRHEGVTRLPVVDAKGVVCGIVTAKDVLSLLSHELNDLISISDAHREAASGQRIMGAQPSAHYSASEGRIQ